MEVEQFFKKTSNLEKNILIIILNRMDDLKINSYELAIKMEISHKEMKEFLCGNLEFKISNVVKLEQLLDINILNFENFKYDFKLENKITIEEFFNRRFGYLNPMIRRGITSPHMFSEFLWDKLFGFSYEIEAKLNEWNNFEVKVYLKRIHSYIGGENNVKYILTMERKLLENELLLLDSCNRKAEKKYEKYIPYGLWNFIDVEINN